MASKSPRHDDARARDDGGGVAIQPGVAQSGDISDRRGPPAAHRQRADDHYARDTEVTVWGDFHYIAGRNLSLAASLVAGVVTLGISSAAQLVWNGVVLGAGLDAIAARCPRVLMPMFSYIPLEFLGLALAAGAGTGIALSIVRYLCLNEPLRLRSYGLVLSSAFVLIVTAAFVEAYMRHHMDLHRLCTTP